MGNWHEAEVSLRQADSIIAGIIEHTGPCELIKHEVWFAGLASSIIGQQLSNQVAKIIKDALQKLNITTIAGGGDTVAAINKTKAEKGFTYISTAGGAFLEWLEGKESPGLKALKNNKKS